MSPDALEDAYRGSTYLAQPTQVRCHHVPERR